MDNENVRTISIRGVGQIKALPDYVILSLVIEAGEKKYVDAVNKAGMKIEKLNAALEKIGFESDSAKTESYRVTPRYKTEKDRKGKMTSTLVGYVCTHKVKLAFDYKQSLLTKVLGMIAGSFANPQLDIRFTVKDIESIKEDLLKATAANARRKAELLCEGAGATLGKLRTIQYERNNLQLDCLARPGFGDTGNIHMETATLPLIDITPEEIRVEDWADFVWEIE